MITYTDKKIFTEKQVEELFLSVNWVSGKYPKRLHKALLNSSTVITAWNDNELVGLIRVLDDSEMLAFIHYVLVKPTYHKKGIANSMLNMVLDKYKDYFYIEVMPEESKNASFYQKYGFKVMEDGVAMQKINSK